MREKAVFWVLFAVYFISGLALLLLSDFWTDETWYFTGSSYVASGKVPYLDFFAHHNPLFYYIYALPQSLFGPDFIVGRLTSLVIMMLMFVLVWRLARRLDGKVAAYIAAGLLITNLFAMYYFTSFSYRILEAFLMVAFFTILFGNLKGTIKYPLATFLLCLVVGVRYPVDFISGLLVLFLVYIAYSQWRSKRIILLSLSVAVLTLAAIYLPFLLSAREQFLFGTIDLPFLRKNFDIEFGVAKEVSLLYRIYNPLQVLAEVFQRFYAVVAIIFGLAVYLGWKIRKREVYIKEVVPKYKSLVFLSVFIILYEVFAAAAPDSSVGLRSITFPAAVIVAGVGLSRVIVGVKDGSTIALYSLIIAMIVISPFAQGFESGRPPLTWGKTDNYRIKEVAARIEAHTEEGDKILTFAPVFAVQAGRELLPGTEMETYSFFPTWETERSRKLNLMNASMLLGYISSKEADAVVLTDGRFFSGAGQGKILDKYRPEILRVLDENYRLAETISNPSKAIRGIVYIYLPRHE